MQELEGEKNVFIPPQKGFTRRYGHQRRLESDYVFAVLQSRRESKLAKQYNS
jgi:hypothetical protein